MVDDIKYEISSSAKQTAALIAGKIIALIVTFAMPLFLTRYLSKADYGLYSQFYLIITFLACFFSIGFETNLFYFYPLASDRDRKSLVLQTFLFLTVFSFIAIGFTRIPLFDKEIIGANELINYSQLIIIGIILIMPLSLIEPLYVVRKDYLTSILYPPSEVLLRFLLVIGFVLLQPGLRSICTGVVSAAAASYIFVLIYAFKEFKLKDINKEIINFVLIRKQLVYNLPFGIAMSLNLLTQRFDKIVCIKFMTPTDFATYSIAFFGIPGIMQVYDSFTKVQVIEMTIKYHENKINEISEIYKSLAAKAYSFSVPLLMIVFLYAKKIIILLFTAKYVDSVPFFRVYLFSFLVFMLGAGLILRASGRTVDTFKSYVYSSVITLPATFFFNKNVRIMGSNDKRFIEPNVPQDHDDRFRNQIFKD
jgi:O-antigen/teichoic acid export membrane protein